MSRFLPLALCLALAAAPVPAEEEGEGDGFSLMQEGAQLLLRGLLQEMEPAIRDLEDLTRNLGPQLELFAEDVARAMVAVVDLIDDIRHYEAPVILENGDILMRRRPDAPPFVPREAPEAEAPEIDL